MKKLTYGMVGGSIDAFIGEVHRKALNFDTRVKFVCGCFSSDFAKTKEVQEAYNLDRVYANYAEMAKTEGSRDDGIDFVVVVTPNVTHYEICKEFLEQGINVMCEKPLCFTIEQGLELEKLAMDNKLLFGVTYTYTGYTMTRVMKEMIAEGKIGKIAAVNAEYVQDWLIGELGEAQGEGSLSTWRKDPNVSGVSNCVGDIGTFC